MKKLNFVLLFVLMLILVSWGVWADCPVCRGKLIQEISACESLSLSACENYYSYWGTGYNPDEAGYYQCVKTTRPWDKETKCYDSIYLGWNNEKDQGIYQFKSCKPKETCDEICKGEGHLGGFCLPHPLEEPFSSDNRYIENEKGTEYCGTLGGSCSDFDMGFVGEDWPKRCYCYRELTCEEKCNLFYEKEGECRVSANSEEGYPEALNQGPQYCEQEEANSITGQATLETKQTQQKNCICGDKKLKVDEISLWVNPSYLKEMNFKEGYSDDGKIREYDEIICKATVIDEEKNTRYAEAYVYLWVNNEKRLPIKKINCIKKESGLFECETKFTPKEIIEKAKGNARGKNISCEIIPFNKFQDGIGKKSNSFIIAKYIFYAEPMETDNYGCIEEQYGYFTEISDIDDNIELSGKLVLFKKFESKKRVKELAKILGRELIPKFDRGIIIEIDPKSFVLGYVELNNKNIIHLTADSTPVKNRRVLAHELGHSYADYCDEYNIANWSEQNNEKTKRGEKGCPNDFPKCCLREEWPMCEVKEGENWWCLGMPYKEDMKTKTDEQLPFGPYWSIMTANLHFSDENIEGGKKINLFLPVNDYYFIYPLPSKCPLRGC